ncbi:GDSL-like Lipase/Acylhydrolase family protein [Mucilaginibacter pineti]|uniref:GDSL-like Lipase/Acylhydrolase family protein n=1 Tax=Mucilaginibacter pineti TaxID=1391627 RepID=A0A1G7F020_9SPHI|nr:SGNH/GDSL hydrolase family protein [Mucilaginibacter pineti]SDE69273.1 GDSL-like Lipase/Acylhydrolase family protein [Mucilaginibacter pineti]
MCKLYSFGLFLFFVVVSLNSCAQGFVLKSKDTRIRYTGRINMTDEAAEMYWTGSSIKFNFNGSGVSAVLQDERGDNYFTVILDGQVINTLHLENMKKNYTLAQGLPAAPHSIELFKRTEWEMGKTTFFQFVLAKDATVLPASPAKKRKIEFFGNSITCGYAVEDTTGQDRGSAPYENGYISYAAITARHYNADYVCTAKSGIGVMVSWFPLIMPEMYNRLDATDPTSIWDFSKYTPDVVVINLFQNDSWIVNMTDNPQFKERFGTKKPDEEQIVKAYRDFVKTIRKKYPKAQILCILGAMDATKAGSPWPGYIEKAVAGLNDKTIYTHMIPYKNTNGHPSTKEQQAMADDLIGFMDKTVRW